MKPYITLTAATATILALVVLATLVGCGNERTPQNAEATQRSLANPVTIGTLPDGRVVSRAEVERGNEHNHFIYFTDNTITVNQSVSNGKTTTNQVTVLIDGVKYAPQATKP